MNNNALFSLWILSLILFLSWIFFFFFNWEGRAGVLTFARLSGHLLFLLKAPWGWGKPPRHGSIQTLFLRPLHPSASLFLQLPTEEVEESSKERASHHI